MRTVLPSLSELTEQVLGQVATEKQAAELSVLGTKIASSAFQTELGALLHKLAEELRAEPAEVTYEDLNAFLKRNG